MLGVTLGMARHPLPTGTMSRGRSVVQVCIECGGECLPIRFSDETASADTHGAELVASDTA